jgi:hypothetical protein
MPADDKVQQYRYRKQYQPLKPISLLTSWLVDGGAAAKRLVHVVTSCKQHRQYSSMNGKPFYSLELITNEPAQQLIPHLFWISTCM